jgi:hypothetical protein
MTDSSRRVTETGPQLGTGILHLSIASGKQFVKKKPGFLGKNRSPVIDNWGHREFTTTTVPRLPGGKQCF